MYNPFPRWGRRKATPARVSLAPCPDEVESPTGSILDVDPEMIVVMFLDDDPDEAAMSPFWFSGGGITE